MMSRSLLLAAVTAFAGLTTPSVSEAAVTITTTTSGVVTGARGVSVLDKVYDITFSNRCAEAYGSCSSAAKFAFYQPTEAIEAARALVDQVFVSGVSRRTTGCSAGTQNDCFSFIGFSYTGSGIISTILMNGSKSFTIDEALDADYFNASFVSFIEASASPVPEPISWTMTLLGLAVIGATMRRPKNALSSLLRHRV